MQGSRALSWLEVKTLSLFTTIMNALYLEDRRKWGECKVPCVVTSVYTNHVKLVQAVMQAKVSVCFCVRWISLIMSGGTVSERMVLLQVCAYSTWG